MGSVRSDMGFAAWRRSDFKTSFDEYTRAAAIFEKAGLKVEYAIAMRKMTFGGMTTGEDTGFRFRLVDVDWTENDAWFEQARQ